MDLLRKTRIPLALTLLFAATHSVMALEAGVAKVRLEIPKGTPLAGDPTRMGRPARAEHDPLWARCLYLDDGELQAYLVTLDFHHVSKSFRDRVVALAEQEVPQAAIILTATHTGNGPGGMEERLAMRWLDGPYRPDLFESMAHTVLGVMRDARSGAQRATLGYGTARQQVLSENARVEGGAVDEQIGVIRVDNADGKALSILSNFSAMPRMAPEEDRYHFSADYPGAYYAALEELSDPGCIAMFLPGACGGQSAVNPEGLTGWAAIESLGELLAVRTKEVANRMSFRDVKLGIQYREVQLPPTLSSSFCPPSVVLQALTLDDLAIVFLPGIPSAEVGIGLRRHLADEGFSSQFVVAASNGYLMDFVTRESFASGAPEASRHLYGPGMADWLNEHVLALLRGAEVPEENVPVATAAESTTDGPAILVLDGPPHARGYERGALSRNLLNARYEEAVASALTRREIEPAGEMWKYWPNRLDPAPVAAPALAMEIRPRLAGLSDGLFAELEGAAEGAAMPFDALWLVQNAHSFSGPSDSASWFLAPFGTLAAVTGDQAGADTVLAGLNVDWPFPDRPLVCEVIPQSGHRYLQVGFDWQLGALAGVNEFGVAIAVLSMGPGSEGRFTGLPADYLLRGVLQEADSFASALARIRESSPLQDCTLMLAGPGDDNWEAGIVTVGKSVSVRAGSEGPLLGVNLERDGISNVTRERYQTLGSSLADERIVGLEELKRALASGAGTESDRKKPWNSETRFSVVVAPLSRTLHVALPGDGGAPGAFATYQLKRESADE